ncbi:MAG TPA: hypothetical protein VNF72_16045 [Myxococcota bacterium]|nr:hypothetical protein [Myxococcota bacterium]
MLRRLLASGGSVSAIFVLACASATRPAPERVLLAPVAFDQRLDAELAQGVTPVREEMKSVLEARGFQVLAPEVVAFAEVWTDATQDVGRVRTARGSLDRALLGAASRALLEGYRARGEALDVVLLGFFEVRLVQVRGWTASWDGVDRSIRADRKIWQRYSGFWPNDRDAPCLSLRVLAYDAEGTLLFDRPGGLEVVSEFIPARLEELPRQDLFEQRAFVREGVEIAIAPLRRD